MLEIDIILHKTLFFLKLCLSIRYTIDFIGRNYSTKKRYTKKEY